MFKSMFERKKIATKLANAIAVKHGIQQLKLQEIDFEVAWIEDR